MLIFYDLQKCYDLAEEYYKKAISLDDHHSMKDSIGLADIYVASGKIDLAKGLIDKMILRDSLNYLLNELYVDIYKAKGDYKKALHFNETCFDIFDSIATKQNKAKVFETPYIRNFCTTACFYLLKPYRRFDGQTCTTRNT